MSITTNVYALAILVAGMITRRLHVFGFTSLNNILTGDVSLHISAVHVPTIPLEMTSNLSNRFCAKCVAIVVIVVGPLVTVPLVF